MAHHCGDDIREHGCPIFFVQEADEAKNLETKSQLMHHTNHQIEHRLRTVMYHYNLLDMIVDSEITEEPQLGLMLDRKAAQKVRSNITRKKTTKVRVSGRLEDLSDVVASTDVDNASMVSHFNERQSVRKQNRKKERAMETTARRALKLETKVTGRHIDKRKRTFD